MVLAQNFSITTCSRLILMEGTMVSGTLENIWCFACPLSSSAPTGVVSYLFANLNVSG